MHLFICRTCIMLCLFIHCSVAEDIRYPQDAVVDLTQAPYNLDPNGINDCTAGFQQALNDHDGDWVTRHILYFPNGTYRFSGGVQLDSHNPTSPSWNGGAGRGIVLQGQSRDGVRLVLDNSASGFHDAANPQVFIDLNESQDLTNAGQNVAFGTNIYNLTIDIGSGNSGATALDFCASNMGGLRDVLITTSDPNYAGYCGLEMSTIPGPQLFKRLEINGFDFGIITADQHNYTSTAEYLTLRHCREVGILNRKHSFTIRKLTATNINGPAIAATTGSLITLIDADISGQHNGSAIINDGLSYLRSINTSGYTRVLSENGSDITGTTLAEWATGGGMRQFNDAPLASLHLPILETPEIDRDDPSLWVNVQDFGARPGDYSNDTPAIQDAINWAVDNGRSTIYFPPKDLQNPNTGDTRYDIDNSITIPVGIECVIGCFALLNPRNASVSTEPMFILNGSGAPLVVEQLLTGADNQPNPTPIFSNTSNRDLVLRNVLMFEGQAYVNTGSGRLFLEDVSACSLRYWGGDPQPAASAQPQFDFGGQDVWARQFDPEQKGLNCLNDGGDLWTLGMKEEEDGCMIKTINGGRTELLGGVLMPLDVEADSEPAYIVVDSEFSAVIAGHIRANIKTGYVHPINDILVRETQAGVSKELKQASVPLRRNFTNGSGDTPPVLLLYSSKRLPTSRVIRMMMIPDFTWSMHPGPSQTVPVLEGNIEVFDPVVPHLDQTLHLRPLGSS